MTILIFIVSLLGEFGRIEMAIGRAWWGSLARDECQPQSFFNPSGVTSYKWLYDHNEESDGGNQTVRVSFHPCST